MHPRVTPWDKKEKRETLADYWNTQDGGLDADERLLHEDEHLPRSPPRSLKRVQSQPRWMEAMEPFSQASHSAAFPPHGDPTSVDGRPKKASHSPERKQQSNLAEFRGSPTSIQVVRAVNDLTAPAQPFSAVINSRTPPPEEAEEKQVVPNRRLFALQQEEQQQRQEATALSSPASREDELSPWQQRMQVSRIMHDNTVGQVPYVPSIGSLVSRLATDAARSLQQPTTAEGATDAELAVIRADEEVLRESLTYHYAPPVNPHMSPSRNRKVPASIFESVPQSDDSISDPQSKSDPSGQMAWVKRFLLPSRDDHDDSSSSSGSSSGNDDDSDVSDHRQSSFSGGGRRKDKGARQRTTNRPTTVRSLPLAQGHSCEHIRFTRTRPEPPPPPPIDYRTYPSHSNVATADRPLPPKSATSLFSIMSPHRNKPSAPSNVVNDTSSDGRVDPQRMQSWIQNKTQPASGWQEIHAQGESNLSTIHPDAYLWHCKRV